MCSLRYSSKAELMTPSIAAWLARYPSLTETDHSETLKCEPTLEEAVVANVF